MKEEIEKIIELLADGDITQVKAINQIAELKSKQESEALKAHIDGVLKAERFIEALKRLAVEKLGITTELIVERADELEAAGWHKQK
ncbi:MAG: hypothetical protein IMY67_11225 [Bacteroidetes bacterium]|nr:hypothetical protein [Bacteroidota bacterium]